MHTNLQLFIPRASLGTTTVSPSSGPWYPGTLGTSDPIKIITECESPWLITHAYQFSAIYSKGITRNHNSVTFIWSLGPVSQKPMSPIDSPWSITYIRAGIKSKMRYVFELSGLTQKKWKKKKCPGGEDS